MLTFEMALRNYHQYICIVIIIIPPEFSSWQYERIPKQAFMLGK